MECNKFPQLFVIFLSLLLFSGCANSHKSDTQEPPSAYSTREPQVSDFRGSEEEKKVKKNYVTAVQNKVISNWRKPFNPYHNRLALVSFSIFPNGHIDKPVVDKSTDNAFLDSLALKAVKASAPFPKFPPEIKETDLRFTIHFRYESGKWQEN